MIVVLTEPNPHVCLITEKKLIDINLNSYQINNVANTNTLEFEKKVALFIINI
jgi:hypothetical protein